MNIHYMVTGILAALFCLLILIKVMAWLSLRRRDEAARAYLVQQPLPSRIYEMGSPVYNAQIVQAVRQVNER